MVSFFLFSTKQNSPPFLTRRPSQVGDPTIEVTSGQQNKTKCPTTFLFSSPPLLARGRKSAISKSPPSPSPSPLFSHIGSIRSRSPPDHHSSTKLEDDTPLILIPMVASHKSKSLNHLRPSKYLASSPQQILNSPETNSPLSNAISGTSLTPTPPSGVTFISGTSPCMASSPPSTTSLTSPVRELSSPSLSKMTIGASPLRRRVQLRPRKGTESRHKALALSHLVWAGGMVGLLLLLFLLLKSFLKNVCLFFWSLF